LPEAPWRADDPVSTEGGFSAGPPTVFVRDVGIAARFSTARRDHSKILIRASPYATQDKSEIRLPFGWQDALRQSVLLMDADRRSRLE